MANFWQKLFNPVPEEGQNDVYERRPVEQKRVKSEPGIAGYLKHARELLAPNDEPKRTLTEEFEFLANKAGYTPTDTKFCDQVKAFYEYLFGKGSSAKSRGNSATDLIEEMVEALGLHPDPSDDSKRKLELVEAELGKNSVEQEKKSLKDRIIECWKDLFGAN